MVMMWMGEGKGFTGGKCTTCEKFLHISMIPSVLGQIIVLLPVIIILGLKRKMNNCIQKMISNKV